MTMRCPTSVDAQLAWWRNATQTGDGRLQGDLPQCGWFKTRLARRSRIWLPARVWLLQPMDWETGELTAPEEYRLEIADRLWSDQNEVAERWLWLRPATMAEWRWLTAQTALRNGLNLTAFTYG